MKSRRTQVAFPTCRKIRNKQKTFENKLRIWQERPYRINWLTEDERTTAEDLKAILSNSRKKKETNCCTEPVWKFLTELPITAGLIRITWV